MNPLTYFQCRLHIIKFISIMHKFLHSIYFCNKKIELFEFKQLRQNPRSTPVCLSEKSNKWCFQISKMYKTDTIR